MISEILHVENPAWDSVRREKSRSVCRVCRGGGHMSKSFLVKYLNRKVSSKQCRESTIWIF